MVFPTIVSYLTYMKPNSAISAMLRDAPLQNLRTMADEKLPGRCMSPT
jgi:hypothetical protein